MFHITLQLPQTGVSCVHVNFEDRYGMEGINKDFTFTQRVTRLKVKTLTANRFIKRQEVLDVKYWRWKLMT